MKAVASESKASGGVLKTPALAMIRFYKRNVSPTLPAACRYEPTCSAYMAEAIERHGFVRGVGMGVWRLMRCHPWAARRYDPVK
ncbi:MAG: membrane protein insertion efficiency factor YidD [Chloroflexota bacterium]